MNVFTGPGSGLVNTHRVARDGFKEHHLVPDLQLPPEDDEEPGFDPDVAAAYDELAKIAKRKRRVH